MEYSRLPIIFFQGKQVNVCPFEGYQLATPCAGKYRGVEKRVIFGGAAKQDKLEQIVDKDKAKEKDEKDYKSIRDAFIKYPSDPVVRRDYLLARRKRGL